MKLRDALAVAAFAGLTHGQQTSYTNDELITLAFAIADRLHDRVAGIYFEEDPPNEPEPS